MKPGAQPADKPAYFDDPAMQAFYQMVLILGEELRRHASSFTH